MFNSQMLLSRSLSSEPFIVTQRSRQSEVFVRTSFNFRKSVTTLSGFSDVTVTPPYQNHHLFLKMWAVFAKMTTFRRKLYISLLKSQLLLEVRANIQYVALSAPSSTCKNIIFWSTSLLKRTFPIPGEIDKVQWLFKGWHLSKSNFFKIRQGFASHFHPLGVYCCLSLWAFHEQFLNSS